MGDRLGWAIFLLFSLAIEGQFTQSHGPRTVSCQGDCVTQDDDEPSCLSTSDPGCDTLDPPSDREVTQVVGPLVRVTHITVTPRAASNQYIVTLGWTSPSRDVQNITRGLRVQWQALTPGGTCSAGSSDTVKSMPATANSTYCQILHFVHSPNSSQVSPTSRWCYTSENPSRCHHITLFSLHGNKSLTVTIRMPPNLTVVEDPAAVSEWKTPVSIIIDEALHSVLALIQAAPADLNITSYKLTLVFAKDGSTIIEHELTQNETSYTFQNITVKGVYVVRVEPLGPGCVPRCQASQSAEIQLQDPSVIVKPAVDQTEYNKSRNIILGTVFGVVFLAIIATVIFCIYRRTRSVHTVGFPMQPFRRRRPSNSSIIMEDTLKSQPIVLLLYSYDCPAHEVVVTTFAYYLKEVANCEVILDIWDQHNLQEQGVYAWLVDKVDAAQFIVLICSTGARFKCARNRQVRMKHDRTLPDTFAWAVDHVAEKIRTATNISEAKTRYVTAYFDYAGKSDIPPKLEITKRFCLMKDLYSLYCHLHSIKPGQNHSSHSKHGLTVDTYSKTDDGRHLQNALLDARHFFKDNPNWLGQTLEPITPVLSASRDLSTENTPEDSSRQKRMEPVSPSVGSENDSFLEERKKKRMRDIEGLMQRVPHPKKEDLPFSTPGTSPSHVPSETSSSVTSMSPLMSPAITAKPKSAPTYDASSGTLPSRELDIDDETDADDTSQMQRDIDFIQNFDAHHTWETTQNGSVGHFFVDVDMGVYTPPEDFISLASLEEEANRAMANSNPASPLHLANSPVASKAQSVSSGLQYQGINSVPNNNGSPRRSGIRANSPASKPSPAVSVSSIGSPSKLNNHSASRAAHYHHQSPAQPSSNPSSHAGSPQQPASPIHINHQGSRTSISNPVGAAEPFLNSTPASGTSTPISTRSQSSKPLSPTSSPSPPHVSSQNPSPFKGPSTNASPGRHFIGSTNGHFVLELEPGLDSNNTQQV